MNELPSFKGFTNLYCQFFPCHSHVKPPFNCLFCYCPLISKECPGPYQVIENKYGIRKDCSSCKIPHAGYNTSWRIMQEWTSVAPSWDMQPQSAYKIAHVKRVIESEFDPRDLEWAENCAVVPGSAGGDQVQGI